MTRTAGLVGPVSLQGTQDCQRIQVLRGNQGTSFIGAMIEAMAIMSSVNRTTDLDERYGSSFLVSFLGNNRGLMGIWALGSVKPSIPPWNHWETD